MNSGLELPNDFSLATPVRSAFPVGTVVRDEENCIEVENKRIQTPLGPKQIIQVKRPLPFNNSYEAVAHLNDGISVLDTIHHSDPLLSNDIHETNHHRYNPISTYLHQKWGLAPEASFHVEELANRRITDKHYEQITGRKIDTVTPYENLLRRVFTKRCNNQSMANYLVAEMSGISKLNYQILDSFNIDVKGEYANKNKIATKVGPKPKKEPIRYVV